MFIKYSKLIFLLLIVNNIFFSQRFIIDIDFDSLLLNPYDTYYYKIIELNSDQKLEIKNISKNKLEFHPNINIDYQLPENNEFIKVEYKYDTREKKCVLKINRLFNENLKLYKISNIKIEYEIIKESFTDLSKLYKRKNENSILKDGDLYKIGISQNGVYKITYKYLKDNINIDTMNTVYINNINIYGNHDAMLSENNSDYRIDDLEKNSIMLFDLNNNNIFDLNDYFLFFAKSPNQWSISGNQFYYNQHLYSDSSFVFLKLNDNSAPKRINNILSDESIVNANVFSTYDEYKVIESEDYNIVQQNINSGSGKHWVGHLMDVVNSYNFDIEFNDLVQNQYIQLQSRYFANSLLNSSLNLTFLSDVSNTTFTGIYYGSYNLANYNYINKKYLYTGNQNLLNLKVEYIKPQNVASKAYIDYIELNAKSNLIQNKDFIMFSNNDIDTNESNTEIKISKNKNIEYLWDVTQTSDVKNLICENNNKYLSFKYISKSRNEFISFNSNSISEINNIYKIDNQNIHSINNIEYVIIYHKKFIESVTKLYDFHKNNGVAVEMIDIDKIYNEFSGGKKDITAIKAFAKFLYDKPNSKFSHMLLFGDASFDPKNRIKEDSDFIPSWQTDNSWHMHNSYVSDDYFALLDDNESSETSDLLDISIGRLPVKLDFEAENLVKKIINYNYSGNLSLSQKNEKYSEWKNQLTFVADDVDEPWEYGFFLNSEYVSNKIYSKYPDINIKKVYMDSYKQSNIGGAERYPQGQKDFRDAVENGTMIISYEGHGGERGLGHERFLDISTINTWTNNNKLPIFLTATCEFTKFDDPLRTSAGEYTLLNPKGGAIAMLSTVRTVYNTDNQRIIRSFYENILEKDSNTILFDSVYKYLGSYTMGEIYKKTKNKTDVISGIDSKKFIFFGDPILRLSLPKLKAITAKINGVDIENFNDTLKALDKVTIEGRIEDLNGSLSNYNGIINVSYYDKIRNLTTLGNDIATYINPFQIQDSKIFKGKSKIENGKFSITFIIPKDINLSVGKSKISYYFYDGYIDGNGSNSEILIGNLNLNAPKDEIGPEIDIELNDNTFTNGQLVDQNPTIIVNLFDSNGINSTSSLGHEISLIVDNQSEKSINLNPYYSTEENTYQKGKATYNIKNLSEGKHNIKIIAWDVYNNFSEKTVNFEVKNNENIVIDNVLNYPNPFTSNTTFYFQHNQSNKYINVNIKIYTISGKLIKTIEKNVKTKGNNIEGINWNTLDDYGNKIAKGTYIYNIRVSIDDKIIEKQEKLVKL